MRKGIDYGQRDSTPMQALRASIPNWIGVPDHEPFEFIYTNWRGETRRRRAYPVAFRFGSNQWRQKPQYLMTAIDADTREEREFAMNDMRPVSGIDAEAQNAVEGQTP